MCFSITDSSPLREELNTDRVLAQKNTFSVKKRV